MFNDEALTELSDPNYWDKRYASQQSVSQNETPTNLDSFEWFRSFDQLRQFFAEYLPSPASGCHILQLGCGNSVSVCFPVAFLLAKVVQMLITPSTHRP
jgi:hypothetical protein